MSAYLPPNFTQSFAPAPTPQGPLSGLRVGVKDLFDVAGYVTRAGSHARAAQPAATRDAEAVACLRAPGRAGGPHQHDRVRLFRARAKPAFRHADVAHRPRPRSRELGRS
ncbi:amidase family protein, partial [Limimaricola cinnabarinus]|uniref:amidase family protein n=1 Tax=Limimaricola cinnabarinus TaxID=1125964 RepID=UPI003F6EF442